MNLILLVSNSHRNHKRYTYPKEGLNICTTMKFKNLQPIHETHYKYIVKERGIKNIHGQIPAKYYDLESNLWPLERVLLPFLIL